MYQFCPGGRHILGIVLSSGSLWTIWSRLYAGPKSNRKMRGRPDLGSIKWHSKLVKHNLALVPFYGPNLRWRFGNEKCQRRKRSRTKIMPDPLGFQVSKEHETANSLVVVLTFWKIFSSTHPFSFSKLMINNNGFAIIVISRN